jgi:tetratricopeptide (TPR) repeat protein
MKAKLGIALLALFILMLMFQVQVDQRKSMYLMGESHAFVPPLPHLVRAGSLGYYNLAADLYWLRTIQYRETCADENRTPKDLYAMTDFLTDLDPRYCLAYFYTGLALMEQGSDRHEIISILSKGVQNCEGKWQNAFLLGFYYYFVLEDYEAAAHYMDLACRWHQGHKLYCSLAARIRTVAGKPELGVQLLQQMLAENRDSFSAATLERRLKVLETKIIERDLTAAVETYRLQHGTYPERVADLFTPGPVLGSPPEGFPARLYRSVPDHPLPGHAFVYDPETHEVRSDPRVEYGYIKPSLK